MAHDIAAFLLLLMPITLAAKTLAFGGLSWLLIRQRTETALGWWINALFVTTTVMSLALTGLAIVLYRRVDASEIEWPVAWLVLIAVSVVPFVVSAAGVGVYVSYRRALHRRSS